MSQMTSLRKAEKACAKSSAPEATAAVAATAAQAPVGSGSRTRPAIVETKTDSRDQACGSSPAGTGTRKRRARPMPTEAASGMSLAPFCCFAGGGGAAFASFASARRPVHRPTLPLGPVPADDPAPPRPGEPPLVVHHVSLLDKERFRRALISEMPRRNAAAVVGLGLLSRAAAPVAPPLGRALAEKSRELAMDKINQGGLSNMYHCLLESSDAEIGAALRALLSSAERGAPALFFCRAGKDRTGIVAALVLCVCGADDGSVLDDYVLSDDPRAEEIALGGLEKSRDLRGLDTRVFARAPREAMERALRRLRERHGSVEAYLDVRAGFTLAEQARLRAALAEKRPTPAM